ncbi:MAG: acyltransferase [Bacteroidota bacterium]
MDTVANMSGVEKLRRDFSGTIFARVRKYQLKLISSIPTFRTYFLAKMMGIKVEKGVRFFGMPILRRAPFGVIKIGKKCTFRSDKISNLIGINRACLLDAHRPEAIIEIGEKCGFSGTVIAAAEKIVIGKNVKCGANSTITDFDWHWVDPKRRDENGSKSSPVYIGDNVWLGLNAIVLKGVRIGENSIITPNSVVVKDIPANVIAGGNPCKVIKEL